MSQDIGDTEGVSRTSFCEPALGVEAITGKPGKPTTQGENERFHQTLFRYLDKQPLAPWEATAKAHPPRPNPPEDLPASAGVVHVDKVFYKIGVEHAFGQVLVVSDGDRSRDTITDLPG